MRIPALLLALFLIVAPLGAKQSKLHQKAEAATTVLYGESESRSIAAHPLCTAWVYQKVSDGYMLLTEGHCFDPEDGRPDDVKYFVGELGAKSEKDGQAIEVIKWQNNADMDAAQLHLKTTKQYEVLDMSYQYPQVEDKVFYVGYPEMVNKSLLVGQVSSNVNEIDQEECEGICKGRFSVQIGGGPGASGSAIIDEKSGKVVGLLEGHMYENGVMAVPTPSVIRFLAQAPPIKQKGGNQ